MRRVFIYVFFIFCITTTYNCSNTSSKINNKIDANPVQVALADSILYYFQQEEFDKIVVNFDDKMKQQLSKEQLAVLWTQLNVQVGTYVKSEFYRTDKLNAVGDIVIYQCYFGSQRLYFQLVFGKENRVIGLFFKPQFN